MNRIAQFSLLSLALAPMAWGAEVRLRNAVNQPNYAETPAPHEDPRDIDATRELAAKAEHEELDPNRAILSESPAIETLSEIPITQAVAKNLPPEPVEPVYKSRVEMIPTGNFLT